MTDSGSIQAEKDNLLEQLRVIEEEENDQFVGQTFNGRKVVALVGGQWRVRCDKGHEKVLTKRKLRRFGCKECQLERMRRGETLVAPLFQQRDLPDLTGLTIGLRTVIARGSRQRTHWLTRCACGVEAEVRGSSLNKGKCTRCVDCARRDITYSAAQLTAAAALSHRKRCMTKDSFGEKKREIQRMIWSTIPSGPA